MTTTTEIPQATMHRASRKAGTCRYYTAEEMARRLVEHVLDSGFHNQRPVDVDAEVARLMDGTFTTFRRELAFSVGADVHIRVDRNWGATERAREATGRDDIDVLEFRAEATWASGGGEPATATSAAGVIAEAAKLAAELQAMAAADRFYLQAR